MVARLYQAIAHLE